MPKTPATISRQIERLQAELDEVLEAAQRTDSILEPIEAVSRIHQASYDLRVKLIRAALTKYWDDPKAGPSLNQIAAAAGLSRQALGFKPYKLD